MAKKQKVNKVFVEKYVADTGYPEVGYFEDQADLKKFYKHCQDSQLDEWLELEGLTDTIKPTDSPQILRMRKCMAILYKHFPKAPAKSKKESEWKKYSLEDLLELVLENEADMEPTDDERIMRMRAVMALKSVGFDPSGE